MGDRINIRISLQTLVILFNLTQTEAQGQGPCRNPVYCTGGDVSILKTLIRAEMFMHSNEYVNLVLRFDEKQTVEDFQQIKILAKQAPKQIDMENFIESHFSNQPELVEWMPSDIKAASKLLARINDITLAHFARALVKSWETLARRVSNNVLRFPTRHSIYAMPNGFIIPGDGYTEPLYWDTYYIVRGLLVCNMFTTVKGILDNFVFMNKINGVIPQASRKYYSYRPHPPLFTAMVALYIKYTDDFLWLRNNINYISTELDWWYQYRTHTINIHDVDFTAPLWGTDYFIPRPEYLVEDEMDCKNKVVAEQEKCINNLRAVEESGWYFSSRWTIFDSQDSSNGSGKIQPQRVIPVDLTAILCQAFTFMGHFYNKIGHWENAQKWESLAGRLRLTLQDVLYDKIDGIWYDYDTKLQRPRKMFFAINFTPLWAECYDLRNREEYGKRAADYFTKQDLDSYYGVPASFVTSGKKWDFPNAFAPMQELVVSGLYETGNKEAQEIARNLANRWIASNLKGWIANRVFYDSYDASTSGMSGTGGDPTKMGYAWTVGVALSFIDKFACSHSRATTILNQFFYTIGYSLSMIVAKLLKML